MLKQLIPPLLLPVLKRWSASAYPALETYEEALKYCPKEAYEDTDIVKVVVDKNLIYKQKIEQEAIFDLGALRTLIGLGLSRTNDSLNVIDFGGGGGYHYSIASNAFGKRVSLKWNVVETTAMANEAQRMANQNLKFFDNVTEAVKDLGEVDLVFTSGTLHCCPEPLIFLRKLLEVKAKYFFITRTCFADSPEQIANIQKSFLSTNGPGPLPSGFKDKAVFYPNVFVSKQKVEEMLCEFYDIQFKTIEDKAVYIVNKKEVDMSGYFCIRKS